MTTALRRSHAETRYLGIEFEINQALVGSKHWRRFQNVIAESARELVPGI